MGGQVRGQVLDELNSEGSRGEALTQPEAAYK